MCCDRWTHDPRRGVQLRPHQQKKRPEGRSLTGRRMFSAAMPPMTMRRLRMIHHVVNHRLMGRMRVSALAVHSGGNQRHMSIIRLREAHMGRRRRMAGMMMEERRAMVKNGRRRQRIECQLAGFVISDDTLGVSRSRHTGASRHQKNRHERIRKTPHHLAYPAVAHLNAS